MSVLFVTIYSPLMFPRKRAPNVKRKTLIQIRRKVQDNNHVQIVVKNIDSSCKMSTINHPQMLIHL